MHLLDMTFGFFLSSFIFLASAQTVLSNRYFGVEQIFWADDFWADDPSLLVTLKINSLQKNHVRIKQHWSLENGHKTNRMQNKNKTKLQKQKKIWNMKYETIKTWHRKYLPFIQTQVLIKFPEINITLKFSCYYF